MNDRKLIPNAVGKKIVFQASNNFEGEHFYHIELSDGNVYVLVSSSPIEVYHEDEIKD